jgi:TetR/AcrR family transcriptional regulator, upper aerobic nicotinate degradation pathway regulator
MKATPRRRATSSSSAHSSNSSCASVPPPARHSVARTAALKPGVRQLAAIATRESILRAATKVFAKHGYEGGKVEQISKAARSYDRMIYYYFGSKEGLFIAVIEEAYRRFNEAEAGLALDEARPERALGDVIRFVWGYYQKNPEFITLLNTENLHRGRHIGKSLRARELSSPVIGVTARVLAAGVQQKIFRADLAARDVYLMIAAMNYFYLSNRHTLSASLGEKLESPEALAHWQAFVVEAVMRTVKA